MAAAVVSAINGALHICTSKGPHSADPVVPPCCLVHDMAGASGGGCSEFVQPADLWRPTAAIVRRLRAWRRPDSLLPTGERVPPATTNTPSDRGATRGLCRCRARTYLCSELVACALNSHVNPCVALGAVVPTGGAAASV